MSKVVGILAALGILGLAGWAFVRGVEHDPAVVGTAITAVAGVTVIVWQRNREKRHELERAHREQMLPIYEELVNHLKDIEAFSSKSDKEQRDFFADLATKLILHGPSPVVNAWNTWQRAPSDPVTPQTFLAWEGLLRAIRDDLGLDGSNIPRGDLLRLWIREDPNEEGNAELWGAIRG